MVKIKMYNVIHTIFKIWFQLPNKVRFILVGGWNTVFGYGLFIVLYYYFSTYINKSIVLLLTFIVGTCHNLITYKIFVFQSAGHWIAEGIKNYLVAIVLYFINLGFLFVLVDYYHFSVYLAQLIIILTLPIILYLFLKYFVFLAK